MQVHPDTGKVASENQTIQLTYDGMAVFDRLVEARREGLEELLAGWSPEQHQELAEMLTRISYELLDSDSEPDILRRQKGRADQET